MSTGRRGVGPAATSAAVRAARSYDDAGLRSTAEAGRPRPAAGEHPQQVPPAGPVHVRDQEQRERLVGAAGRRRPAGPRRPTRVSGPSDASTPRTCAAGSSTAVSVVGGVQSARSAAAVEHVLAGAGEQVLARAARGSARGPARSSPARRCARRRWRRTARRCRRTPARRTAPSCRPRRPASAARPASSAPGHPGADPVGGEQGVHRPAVARLAAAQVVGALERRAERRAGVGVPGCRRPA